MPRKIFQCSDRRGVQCAQVESVVVFLIWSSNRPTINDTTLVFGILSFRQLSKKIVIYLASSHMHLKVQKLKIKKSHQLQEQKSTFLAKFGTFINQWNKVKSLSTKPRRQEKEVTSYYNINHSFGQKQTWLVHEPYC